MTGTLVNAGAIVAGSLIGVAIRQRMPRKITDIVFQGVGLLTLAIGISMSLQARHMILIAVSIVTGGVAGQALNIDQHLQRLGERLQSRYPGKGAAAASDRFSEGFVTASVLFCVGSMAILGAIEDGTGNTPNLLYTKSIMDGISSIALASTFGVAIVFSSVPVLLYQGAITLSAAFAMRYMSESMTADMTATGGILLMGLAIHILKIKEINVTNMLPSLVIVVLLSGLVS